MSKKKTKKKAAAGGKRYLPVLVIVAILIVGVIAAVVALRDPDNGGNVATGNFVPMGTAPEINIDDLHDVESQPQKGLSVRKIGSYTGIYMEDGTNAVLSRIMMIVVENTSDRTVQYAEIEMTDGTATALFSLSTLPAGESVVLLEKNRMSYDAGKGLNLITVKNAAVFHQEPNLCEDKVKIQALNGALNVTNISETDITGDIVIYYKNASADMLYGGITYRVTIKGGIKAGEVKQVVASHYSIRGSRIMFVTVA
jgi:hypothetical protein